MIIALVVFQWSWVQGLDDLIELYKKQCDSQSLPHHCLSYLISISYTLLSCYCMYLYFTLILTSSQQQRGCTGSEGVQNAHSPEEGMWRKNAKACTHHSGTLSLSPCEASVSLLSSCRLPLSALSAQRKRWLRPGAQQGVTRASEFPG